jgi:hypothetical protein
MSKGRARLPRCSVRASATNTSTSARADAWREALPPSMENSWCAPQNHRRTLNPSTGPLSKRKSVCVPSARIRQRARHRLPLRLQARPTAIEFVALQGRSSVSPCSVNGVFSIDAPSRLSGAAWRTRENSSSPAPPRRSGSPARRVSRSVKTRGTDCRDISPALMHTFGFAGGEHRDG